MTPAIEIPGYEIKRLLGKGGMAAVYLAVQKSFGREVAIKVLSPQHADEEFSQRFLREAQIVSRLMHPNIVTVYDVGIHEGYHYLSMEYIPGKDLKQAGKNLPKPKIIDIIKQVAGALEYAAQKGYVHRDVKPDNIMLHADGRAILMDFGIARMSEAQNSVTQTGKVVGTPHYMSPEQTKGMKVDHRSDIYSLGVVLYQLLSGHVPFDGETPVAVGIKHISEPIPLLPAGMEIFQPIINTCMSKDPDHRYQTAGQLIAALNGLDPKAVAAIDTKAAAFRQAGSNPNASTMVTPAATQQATVQVVHPPLVHPGPRKKTVVDSGEIEEVKPRTTRNVLLLLLLMGIGWAAYAEQARLQKFWQEQLAPQLQQLAVTLGLHTPTPAPVVTENVEASPLSSEPLTPADATTATAETFAPEHNDTEAVSTTSESTPTPLSREAQIQQLRDGLENNPENGIELATLYREALQQQPGETQAQQGLQDLQEWYREQTRSGFEQQDLAKVRQLLEIMQQSFPRAAQHERFQQIQQRLERAEAIQAHLRQAQAYQQAKAYIAPAEQNALAEYTAVLGLAPNHAQARQAINDLSDLLYTESKQLYSEGKLKAALTQTKAAQQAFNNEPRFIQLSKQIQASQQKLQRIASALNKADSQYKTGNLITPAGESAFDYYQQVLKEDSQHSRARAGLQNIEKNLVNDIEALININNFSQAQQQLTTAKQFFSNSTALDASDKKLAQAIDAISPKVTRLEFNDTPIIKLGNNTSTTLKPGRTLYVGFTYKNFNASTTLLQAILTDGSGRVQIAQKPVVVAGKLGEHYFEIELPVAGFAEGSYNLLLVLDNKPLIASAFVVSGKQ